jgi:hypothetical protein
MAAAFRVYVADATELVVKPVAAPIAFTVCVTATVIGPVYNCVVPVIGNVGVVPSVVKYIAGPGVVSLMVTVWAPV